MDPELLHLRDLLAETERLKARFEETQPDSARLAILNKDAIRLRHQIRTIEAAYASLEAMTRE